MFFRLRSYPYKYGKRIVLNRKKMFEVQSTHLHYCSLFKYLHKNDKVISK